MTPIIIPQLDANLVDVTITRWRKQIGETIAAGEIIADLTTDKAAYELDAPTSGTLLSIIAKEKSIVPAGSMIGEIGLPGEERASPPPDSAVLPQTETSGLPENPHLPPPEKPVSVRIRATPRVRRLAQERGLDLAKIQAETAAEIIDESVFEKYLSTHPTA